MPAPAFRSSSTSGNVTAASDTITKPSGVAQDDILLYKLYLETDLANAVSPPSGWTQIRSQDQLGFSIDYRVVWFWKRATGSEPANYTFSGWSSNFYESCMAAFSGAIATGTPYEAEDGTVNGSQNAAPVAPSVTTLGAQRLIVCGYSTIDGGNAIWAPASSGMAENVDAGSNSIFTVAQQPAGASGTKTVSCTGGINPEWHTGTTLALIPATVTPQAYFVAAGASAWTATSGATLAPGLPSGWAADDVHVLVAYRNDNTAMTSLAGSGWTQLAGVSGNTGTGIRVEVWWRRAVGGDAAPTVTFGTGTIVRGARIYGVRAALASGDPFDTGTGAPTRANTTSSSLTIAFTDLTTTTAGCLVLAVGAYDDDLSAVTTLANYTQPAGAVDATTLGNDATLFHEYRELAAAGAAGLGNVTGTGTSSPNAGIGLALLPASASTPTRDAAGSLPAQSGALSRLKAALRSLTGSQPAAAGALSRVQARTRSLTGSWPAGSGTLARVYQALRSLTGSWPAGSGALSRVLVVPRSLAGDWPAAAGALTRRLQALRSLTGNWPAASGALSRRLQALRSLAGNWPAASGALSRIQARTRSLTGSWPAASGALSRLLVVPRSLTGSWPAGSGALSRTLTALRALAGSMPAASGALARVIAVARSLTGAWPAAGGAVSRKLQALRALAGNQPAGSGALAAEVVGSGARALTGNWPAAAGSLARVYKALRSLAGDWPAASGALTRSQARTRSLTGSQPAGSGALSRVQVVLRSLTGSWPAGSGALARRKGGVRGLTGSLPAQSAGLARHYDGKRSLAGEQAAAVGEVVRLLSLRRPLAGALPAASGAVTWSLPFGQYTGYVVVGDGLLGGAAVGDLALGGVAVGDRAVAVALGDGPADHN